MAKEEEKMKGIEKDNSCGCGCNNQNGKWTQVLFGLKFGLGFFLAAFVAFIALVVLLAIFVFIGNSF